MKRCAFAVLAFLALAFAATPVAAANEEPGSGTLTWAVPIDVG
ncbi:hypothetical protein [Amycolatopsis alkalitolerans]|nr:hypothetical protein [Amycolatopsis alkalitolerans]